LYNFKIGNTAELQPFSAPPEYNKQA